MVEWEETARSVRDLIERFGRPGERSNVHYPVAALHRAGLWELDAEPLTVPSAHGSSVLQGWFDEHQPCGGLVASVYELVRDSAPARDAAVDALVDAYFVNADPAGLLDELGLLGKPDASEASAAERMFTDRAARYKDLCELADIYWSGGRDSRHEASLSARLRRSVAAREAVLLRSGGRCENPRCTGDVQDVTDSGAPILEVDHVRDLTKGGPDKPDQMVAPCPNCHATKTRGRTRQSLQRELLVVTGRRHQAYLTGRSADGAF
jgi:5-methylcytosine-specific restriction enzyme A